MGFKIAITTQLAMIIRTVLVVNMRRMSMTYTYGFNLFLALSQLMHL